MHDKMTSEKQVSFEASNTFSTLNEFGSNTKNVWLVFHGMGHLSRYFIRHFKELNSEENYVIAPQAPSKYYQGSDYKHVGSSWLTRENTRMETQNVLSYVDAVWELEKPSELPRFIVLGYSQGVSIATRWLTSRKINCDHLVLHSGGIPKELETKDFSYLPNETKVTFLYGNKDPYITETRKRQEVAKATKLFNDRLEITEFSGAHEVYHPYLYEISVNN